MLPPLLALTAFFVSAAEPPRTGPGFIAALAVEVRAHDKILGPDYDYKEWRCLREGTSQAAINAAADKDAEFYAWQSADEALDAMQAFSTRLKEVTARGAANRDEWDLFEKDIDKAFLKAGLKAEKELRQLYLDRVPRPGGEGSMRTGPGNQIGRVPSHLDTDRFKDPNFDGGATRPAFKEPEARAERPAYVYTAKAPAKAKSVPTLPKVDIFAYKPEGREAARIDSIKWTMGGWAETWSGPPKKRW